jgi:pyruvate formate lyase activating enzyme
MQLTASSGKTDEITSPGTRCASCLRRTPLISAALGVCGDCIRRHPTRAVPLALAAHAQARRPFSLPDQPPRTSTGVKCPLCARECQLGIGERGYCGLRSAGEGRLLHLAGTPRRGLLRWYRDPLPTNCVADWVCSGSHQRGGHNLAVFYCSCTLNCLFCQNWHFREISARRARGLSAGELAAAATAETFCACFFGGDPASQMPHALAAAQQLAEKGVTVCWETAGTSNPKLLDRAFQLSLDSGGCIKFDLKAYDEALHIALTGASNRRTLDNFARAAGRFGERPLAPPVVASTLLVPGYVDAEEVGRVARYIAALNANIPYALLAFAPHFYMHDLPPTSLRHAQEAEAAAREAGLTNVRIGNRHLLSREY